MRTARAGLLIASVALAAVACGGSTKLGVATPASPSASSAATSAGAAPTTADAAPTAAADSPSDAPTGDPAATDSPSAGGTGTTSTSPTSTDPTLLALSDLPAGFTVIPPDVTTAGEPGICGVPYDGSPGSTDIQRVSFHAGSGATEQQVSEHFTQYPDAATATAAYATEVKGTSCGTYDDSATGTTTVGVTKVSDTEMQIDITGTVSGTAIEAKGVVLVVGDKVYSGGLTAVAPVDGSVVTTVVTTVEQKAGA